MLGMSDVLPGTIRWMPRLESAAYSACLCRKLPIEDRALLDDLSPHLRRLADEVVHRKPRVLGRRPWRAVLRVEGRRYRVVDDDRPISGIRITTPQAALALRGRRIRL